MSRMIELDFHPQKRTLRQFGWIALVGFGFIAGIAWWELLVFGFGLGSARPWVTGISLGLACISALFSLLWPAANRPLYVGLSLVTFPIGFVLSWLILAGLFYGLFTPMGLFMRLIGRDALNRSFLPDADSYWVDARSARPRDSYFRQY